ncbi:hypothetical protein QBC38DRAFT_484535 [Podospora fimiseda]|uniref:Uncharacterized protein n=1 Tax=Podospora fimiseda TaxID=252190 RepID=A0AAN7BKA0_9PEZI|nr:hypothetical protein QBC38DRAFT_484535 [Podospora fimiseda]
MRQYQIGLNGDTDSKRQMTCAPLLPDRYRTVDFPPRLVGRQWEYDNTLVEEFHYEAERRVGNAQNHHADARIYDDLVQSIKEAEDGGNLEAWHFFMGSVACLWLWLGMDQHHASMPHPVDMIIRLRGPLTTPGWHYYPEIVQALPPLPPTGQENIPPVRQNAANNTASTTTTTRTNVLRPMNDFTTSRTTRIALGEITNNVRRSLIFFG